MLLTLLPGCVPTVVHNLRSDFAPVRYHLADRHGTRPRPEALLEHVATQAALVTPLLFVALIGVLVVLCRRAARGEDRAQLLSIFALTHLGTFLLASPLADDELISAHWPVPGYLPLLLSCRRR